MSRVTFLILFVLVPVLARSRGGGGHSGHSGGHASHSYPSSHGLSGHSPGHHSGQAATYPHSTGLSGNNQAPHHTYGTNTNQATHHSTSYHNTQVHHHYHYSPPQHITYGSGYHPVYYGRPPVYVYEYRDSGSRFNTLLTGLALYNLGRMSAHHDHSYYDPHREYRGTPGEICKLQINKPNGEYEETRIDCKLMSSYIWEAEQERNRIQNTNTVVNTNTVTTVNATTVHHTNSNNDSTVVTTVQNTTLQEAVTVKGPSIEITSGMDCYMIRMSRDSSFLRKKVECGLLQAYALNSFKNDAWCKKPMFVVTTLLSLVLFLFK